MDAVYEVFRVSSILLEDIHLESFDIDHFYTVLTRLNSGAFQSCADGISLPRDKFSRQVKR